MNVPELHAALDASLADRQLLTHPFYRRWEAGTLGVGELGAYAAQYRYFEAALSGLLRDLLSHLEQGAAADLVRENLTDEESNPEPHVVLFDSFADAVGAQHASAGPAVTHLLDVYRSLIDQGGPEGLSAIVAYEMQAPQIAASKADGLREHYGVDAQGTRFWDIHADMDRDHAQWGIEALVEFGGPEARMTAAAREAADAWWGFLDEREAGGPVSA